MTNKKTKQEFLDYLQGKLPAASVEIVPVTKDVIHNSTTVHYGLLPRIKILLGGKSNTDLEIHTKNEIVHVIKSEARTRVLWPEWVYSLRRFFDNAPKGETID